MHAFKESRTGHRADNSDRLSAADSEKLKRLVSMLVVNDFYADTTTDDLDDADTEAKE